MPRVVVNAAAAACAGDLSINVNVRPATLLLRPVGWRPDDVYLMQDRTWDLLLIAASVFTADSLVSRGGDVRSGHGTAWRRDLRFVLPVRDAEFWRTAHEALAETLKFLTGDDFTFTFVQRSPSRPTVVQGGLFQPAFADEVILFSGGLDSLAGAFETLATTGSKVLLVTHRSATKTARVQKELFQELDRRFRNRITWVPVRGRILGRESIEATQRSRSFLYAALGYAAASIVGVAKVRFYENGVVSLNLPISRQVLGTMATRTTHPLFLRHMEALLGSVAGRPIKVENPYVWLTKTEVVERLRNCGGSELIPMTTSCSSVRARTRRHPHCGCCSQCIDRRFATLAAGVAEHDPADRYEVDLFLGARGREQDRTMAHDWTRHALRRLAKMEYRRFADAFAAELSDLAAGRPGMGDAHARAFQLHRRHGDSVRGVVTQTLATYSGLAADGEVPAHSLLSALLSDHGDAEEIGAGDVYREISVEASPDETAGIFPLRLSFVPSAGPWLRIRNLGEFRGAHYRLVGALRPSHAEDVAGQLAPDGHRYVQAGHYGPKGTARQHAKRCRDEFAETYEAIEGARPPDPLLIQNKPSRGYRLDPEARFVDDPEGEGAA